VHDDDGDDDDDAAASIRALATAAHPTYQKRPSNRRSTTCHQSAQRMASQRTTPR
jgi:hypothetical protein